MSDVNYKRIEDHPNLIRDVKSNAVINKNSDVVIAAVARRQKAKQQDDDIAMLKSEMTEIKKMLSTLINNSNNETK
jgi:hypothetical protein